MREPWSTESRNVYYVQLYISERIFYIFISFQIFPLLGLPMDKQGIIPIASTTYCVCYYACTYKPFFLYWQVKNGLVAFLPSSHKNLPEGT